MLGDSFWITFVFPPCSKSFFDVPEEEREARIQVNEDLCRIRLADDETQFSYFIRVILEIPIKGATEPFMWGVWVSQSQDSFERYRETFDQNQPEEQSFGSGVLPIG